MYPLKTTRDLGLEPAATGKVRETFDLGRELFIVATDRISAYDVVMDDLVPGRGVVLTVMTAAWLKRFSWLPNHLLTVDPAEFPREFRAHAEALAGRSMLVRKAERLPIECVARGYLAGSGWQAYRQGLEVCGHRLPAGLVRSQRLAKALFTPAIKADVGHDENISFADTVALVGEQTAARLRDATLRLYREAADFAEPRGVLIADTKFEFGWVDGELTLIDEVLTPDSSRFWPAAEYRAGEDPPSWDKQILRNHLDTLEWNREPPPPALPAAILDRTAARYREVLEVLFPAEMEPWRKCLA